MNTKTGATIEDLYHVKAEIVNGEIVYMSPTGGLRGFAAGRVYANLLEYGLHTDMGVALPRDVGFIVSLPHRRTFNPDAAFYKGKLSMKFVEGAPIFAVEMRSENDYGPAVDQAIAAKIADYFAAGTQVVWDVDLQSEEVVRVYRAGDPTGATIYRRGQVAEAEPALPGWTMPVDNLSPEQPG